MVLEMLRGYAFALMSAVFVTLSCAGARAQAAPSGASSFSAQVETPAPPTQSAPSTQAPPTNPAPLSAQSGPVAHTISVTFDYDFDRTPACIGEIKHRCVKQFVVYDISSGLNHVYQIGIVALPDNPHGQRRSIPGKTDPHVFAPGRHLIAVTAQEAEPQPHPLESNTAGCASCTAWINIP